MIYTRTLRATGFVATLALLAACGGTSGEASESDEPQTVTVPAGTEVVVQLNEELSTRSHAKGDAFTAQVSSAVSDSGRVAIPAGATVHGEVTGVQRADDQGRKGVLSLDVTYVEIRGERHPVSARVIGANPEARSETSTGEAAATGVVLATKDGYAVLPQGSNVRLELSEALTVPVTGGQASADDTNGEGT